MEVRIFLPPPTGACLYVAFEYRRKGELLKTASTAVLSTIVTADMLGGVLNEIVGLLPVVIPVMIGFIALRKGIAFVMGALRAA